VKEPRNRKLWRVFLGLAGIMGMFSCGLWAIHMMQTRTSLFPESIFMQVNHDDQSVMFDHLHIIGLRLDLSDKVIESPYLPDADIGPRKCLDSPLFSAGVCSALDRRQKPPTRAHSPRAEHILTATCGAEDADYETLLHSEHKKYRYASCDNRWFGLSLLDFALLSQAGYFDPDAPQLSRLLDMMFPTWMAVTENRTHDDGTGGKSAPAGAGLFELRFLPANVTSRVPSFEVFSRALNTSVIVIRGTDPYRANDYLEDVRIWCVPTHPCSLTRTRRCPFAGGRMTYDSGCCRAEAGFMRIISFFPTMQMWSDRLTSIVIGGLINEQLSWCVALSSFVILSPAMGTSQHMVFCFARFGVGFDGESSYYTPLVNYVKSINDRNVVLTGHSLGGGLARIVGAFTGSAGVVCCVAASGGECLV